MRCNIAVRPLLCDPDSSYLLGCPDWSKNFFWGNLRRCKSAAGAPEPIPQVPNVCGQRCR